jgi:hypothetical protein
VSHRGHASRFQARRPARASQVFQILCGPAMTSWDLQVRQTTRFGQFTVPGQALEPPRPAGSTQSESATAGYFSGPGRCSARSQPNGHRGPRTLFPRLGCRAQNRHALVVSHQTRAAEFQTAGTRVVDVAVLQCGCRHMQGNLRPSWDRPCRQKQENDRQASGRSNIPDCVPKFRCGHDSAVVRHDRPVGDGPRELVRRTKLASSLLIGRPVRRHARVGWPVKPGHRVRFANCVSVADCLSFPFLRFCLGDKVSLGLKTRIIGTDNRITT